MQRVREALLGAAFAGVVASDRWSVYNWFAAERRALYYAHLKQDFQALVDRGGEAERIERWGLAEIGRLFALWHRFRAGEFDRQELLRRRVPLEARMGRLWRRGNVSERALRPAVLWRERSFGSDSEAGSRFAERLLTVVATRRQQGRSLLDFLVAVGEAALRGHPPPSLLSAPLGG